MFFLTQTKLTLDNANACFLACASIIVPTFQDLFFLGKTTTMEQCDDFRSECFMHLEQVRLVSKCQQKHLEVNCPDAPCMKYVIFTYNYHKKSTERYLDVHGT